MELNSPGIYIENFLANCDNWNTHKKRSENMEREKGKWSCFQKRFHRFYRNNESTTGTWASFKKVSGRDFITRELYSSARKWMKDCLYRGELILVESGWRGPDS